MKPGIEKVTYTNLHLLFEFSIRHTQYQNRLKRAGKPIYFNFFEKEEEIIQCINNNPHLLSINLLAGFYIFTESSTKQPIGIIYIEDKLLDGYIQESIGFLPEAHGKGYGGYALTWLCNYIAPYVGNRVFFKNNSELLEEQYLKGVSAVIDTENFISVYAHARYGFGFLDYRVLLLPEKNIHTVLLCFPITKKLGISFEINERRFIKYIKNHDKLLLRGQDCISKLKDDRHKKGNNLIKVWDEFNLPLYKKHKSVSSGDTLLLRELFRLQKTNARLTHTYHKRILNGL